MIREFKAEKLSVKLFETREEMGAYSADEAVEYIKEQLKKKETVNIVFAAAPSQNDFLRALRRDSTVEWERVNAFHMDEYIGLSPTAPQGFGNFLKEAAFDHLPLKQIYYIYSDSLAPEENCRRYEELLANHPIDAVFMGIGENGHIAFNDPHVAMFDDPCRVKVVDLDQECRQQQVNDGCFDSLDAVPKLAITLTIPTLMSGERLFCMVPTALKSEAVKGCVEGAVSEACPASILRTHGNATLYCDRDSACKLKE